MTLNLSDFGLTSFIDFTNDGTLTFDAQRRMSAAPDSLGLIANFTQATDANKMLLSRSDNRENVFLNSGELGNASWTKSDVTAPSAGTVSGFNAFKITEAVTTATHFITNAVALAAVSGQTSKVLVRVKGDGRNFIRISRAGGAVGVTFELTGAGAKLEATATGSIALQSDGYYLCEANIPLVAATAIYLELKTALTTGAETYAGNIANGVLCYEPQFQFSAGADNTPLTTTDHPQYAGLNGKTVAVCNGAQALISTSTSANVFAASTKLLYVMIQPFSAIAGSIFRPSGGARGALNTTASVSALYDFRENDGALKVATSGAAVVNTLTLVRAQQVGGNLIVGISTGADFVDGAPVACGAGTDLTQAVQIGATSGGFFGKIAAIATANTGAAKPNLENLLRDDFFARSMMQWDPLQADLVIKKR